MKISIYKLISILGLENELSNQKFSIKTAYTFSKIFSRAREELEFYQTKYREIISLYGEKDEDGEFVLSENGNIIYIQKDKIEECKDKLNELQNLEVDLPDYKIHLDELDSIKLSTNEISILLPFICEN